MMKGRGIPTPDALAEIGKVANRPIVIDVENLVGLGATGGFVLNNVAYAKEVASLALRILDGDSVTANPVEVSEFTQPVFDWRQLQRGVSAKAGFRQGVKYDSVNELHGTCTGCKSSR